MDVKLVVQTGERKGREIPVDVHEFVIGRDPSCQFRLDSDQVSQRHCRILLLGGRVTVEDLDSTNGTAVNDRYIRSLEVQHGDRLKVGPTSFVFLIATEPEDLERRTEDWIISTLDQRTSQAIPANLRDSASDTETSAMAKRILGKLSNREGVAADRTRLRVGESRGITVVKFIDNAVVEETDIREISEELSQLIEAGRRRIVLNFGNVEHLSSQAIGMVLRLFKHCAADDGKIKICKLRPRVADVFSMTGVKRIIEIFPDERSAVESAWPDPSRAKATPRAVDERQPAAEPEARAQETAAAAALSAPQSQAGDAKGSPQGAAESSFEPQANPLQVCLHVMVGKAQGRTIEIKSPRFLIGRDPRCHLRPNSPAISRIHASIEQRAGRVFVRDMGTHNGSTLGARTLQGEEVEASNGDRLQVGPLLFTLEIQERAGKEALQVEEEAAGWLLDGEEGTNFDAPTATLMLPSSKAQPCRPAAPPREAASPPSSPEGEALPGMRHLRYEVIQDVLAITILTPNLNDETTVGPVRYELSNLFELPLPRQVVVNLEHVTFLSSRAVGILLAHFQRLERAGGAMRICQVRPSVLAILEAMRLPMLVEVYPGLDEAVLEAWE